jgi:hypothetical protein
LGPYKPHWDRERKDRFLLKTKHLDGRPSIADRPEPTLRRICSWCGLVLVAGDAPTPVSHAMCPSCAITFSARKAIPVLLALFCLVVSSRSAESRFDWKPSAVMAARFDQPYRLFELKHERWLTQ